MVEVAAEKNSTLVLPFPVELLRFLERSTPDEPASADAAAPTDCRRPAGGSLLSPPSTTTANGH